MLRQYEGEKVILESQSGKIYRGIVGDYCYPEDNDNEKESIIIDAIGYSNPMEFFEEDIKRIDIIK